MCFRLLFYVFIFLSAVNNYVQKSTEVSYKSYPINRSLQSDSLMEALLQPYKDSVGKYLNKVIGFSTFTMYKHQPESALGNLLADCLKYAASKDLGVTADIAIVNFGSLHASIIKGDITVQNVYDVMPYDNGIVLLKITGNTLHQLLDRAAYSGGWPCSGMTMEIKNKEAIHVFINGLPLTDTATYTLAVTNYLVNGGDGCAMLKKLPRTTHNYSFREALIDYIIAFTQSGKPVTATVENRIVNDDE